MDINCNKFYEQFMGKFKLKVNEPMNMHTSFKVGGTADLFACPGSVEELKQLLLCSKKYNIPVTIFGSGTNVLVKDKGIRGLVICITGIKDNIKIIQTAQSSVFVRSSAGTLLSKLGKFAMEKELKGLSFAAGIPGTVGGAVMMNSSTRAGQISDIISWIEVLDSKGKVQILKKSDINLFFNGSSLKKDLENHVKDRLKSENEFENDFFPVILGAGFELTKGDREKLKSEWHRLLIARKVSQPVSLPSAGCFFKNPDYDRSAGELIDMAGLKGEKIGNAMVSEQHANFIVNSGKATACDILLLKKHVEQKVFELFSIHLKTEVKIEGE